MKLFTVSGIYVLVIYLIFLGINTFGFNQDYNCEIRRRIDYIFPARQLNCFLYEIVKGEDTK